MRVTLPLSRPAILAGLVIVSLPMFGDYYTHDLLNGNVGKTSMVGNMLDETIGSEGHQPQAAVDVLIPGRDPAHPDGLLPGEHEALDGDAMRGPVA